MRFFRWMSLVGVFAAACSARGGGGFGPLPTDDAGDPDAMVPPGDTPPTGDAPPGADVPPGVDAPVGMDVPVGDDRVVPPIDNPQPTDIVVPDKPEPVDNPPPIDRPMESCGNGTCEPSLGETSSTCPTDCPLPSCAGSSCGDCVMAAGCGWCGVAGVGGVCVPGNLSGPTGTTPCPSPAMWVGPGRGTQCTSAPDAGPDVPDVIRPDVPTTDPTRTCTTAEFVSGVARECNWRNSGSFTCTPGASVTLGCTIGALSDAGVTCTYRLGSCSGDPILRVCAGSAGCNSSGAIASSDDSCGLCPVTTFTCPSAGRVTVFTGAYNSSTPGSCTVSVR